QYFGEGDGAGTRNDFLGTPIKSFGCLPGCHLGFFDLDAGEFVIHTQAGAMSDAFDAMPKRRAVKLKEGVQEMVERRLPDSTEKAIRACIGKTRSEGVREVLKYALRRDAYKEEAEAIRAKV